MKETAGSEEFDFVEKAPNTYPNLCGPVNQHANQEEGKYKKGERAKRGGCIRLMCVGGVDQEERPTMQQKRKNVSLLDSWLSLNKQSRAMVCEEA